MDKLIELAEKFLAEVVEIKEYLGCLSDAVVDFVYAEECEVEEEPEVA